MAVSAIMFGTIPIPAISCEKSNSFEIEFPNENEEIDLPPCIEIVKEVTGLKGYSNFALAMGFPPERFD